MKQIITSVTRHMSSVPLNYRPLALTLLTISNFTKERNLLILIDRLFPLLNLTHLHSNVRSALIREHSIISSPKTCWKNPQGIDRKYRPPDPLLTK